MGLEDVLKFAFHAAKEQPRVLLPATISWIPTVMTTVMVASILSEFSLANLFQAFSDPRLFMQLLIQMEPFLLVFIVVSWIVGAFIQALYTEITHQYARHRRPDIAKAFYAAKNRLLSMMWINLLAYAVAGLVVAVPAATLGAMGFFMAGPSGALVFGALGLFLGIIPAIYLVIRLWLAPVVLVIESKKGFDALLRSFRIMRGKFWHAFIVLVVIAVVSGIINLALSYVPLVSFSLTLIASLFFTAWAMTAPAAFYFEYKLGKKK